MDSCDESAELRDPLIAELVEVSDLGIALEDYFRAMVCGASRVEVLEAARWMSISSYVVLRMNGVAHDEVREIRELDVNDFCFSYVYARVEAGAVHQEIKQALAEGMGIFEYAVRRREGASHRDILDQRGDVRLSGIFE